jgi:predicted AAA+ superfamily ATPase
MYIPRYVERTLKTIASTFKVLYLGGPRQVGKTTVLQHLAAQRRMRYVTLDDLTWRDLARRDPELFLEEHPAPLLIDEVQYAPELFPALKRRVDRSPRRGQYWLTGSQQFAAIRRLQESLAGRVGIATLLGFSHAEIARLPAQSSPFLPMRTLRQVPAAPQLAALDQHIFRGSFPALWDRNPPPQQTFFNSYIQTYLDRDLSDLFGVQKLSEFHACLQLLAARTGQLLNYAELARDLGVSLHAVREWVSILEGTRQIYLLRPYYRNITKRMIKAPKVYVLDTGLAAHLTKWTSPEALAAGAMAGPFFETHIIGELIKSYLFRGVDPPLFYFRDKEGHEVDVLIEHGQRLFPIEIKRAARVSPHDVRQIIYLQRQDPRRVGMGTVIALSAHAYPMSEAIRVLPVTAIQ